MTTLLRIEGLRSPPILQDIRLQIESHDIVLLKGKSGSGKSTLLRSIVRIDPNHEGDIYFQDQRISPERITHLRSQVHYQPQTLHLTADTIREFLSFPYHLSVRKNDVFHEEKARHVLNQLGLGSVALDTKTKQLSGGEVQRILLTRSLLLSPKVLMLDEPWSALDAELQFRAMQVLIEEYCKGDVPWAMIVVLHHGTEDFLKMDFGSARLRKANLRDGKMEWEL